MLFCEMIDSTDEDILNDRQDIKIVYKPDNTNNQLITIRELINDENINNSEYTNDDIHDILDILNTKIYHIATLWSDSDTEFKIGYNPVDDTMYGYASDINMLFSSAADIFDLALYINAEYTNKEIINMLFDTFAKQIITLNVYIHD